MNGRGNCPLRVGPCFHAFPWRSSPWTAVLTAGFLLIPIWSAGEVWFGPANQTSALHPLRDIAIGDLTGDEVADVVYIAGDINTAHLGIMLNNGWGGLELQGELPGVIRSVAMGDLNGDEDVDVAAVAYDLIRLFYNEGDGEVVEGPYRNPHIDSVHHIAVDDLDLDGHIDLVAVGETEVAIQWGSPSDPTTHMPALAFTYTKKEGNDGS